MVSIVGILAFLNLAATAAELQAAPGEAGAPRVSAIANIKTFERRLTSEDPFDTILTKSHARGHMTVLKQGVAYRIDLVSAEFDPILRIFDSAGKLLASNDDGGEGLNARLFFIPERTDDYRLHATSFAAGQTGAFRLMIQEYVPGPGAREYQARLTTGGLKTNDGRPVALQKISLEADGEYVIDVVSADFNTAMILRDSTGKGLASDDDGGKDLNARLFFRAPGTDNYEILVYSSQPNAAGQFRIVVQPFTPVLAGRSVPVPAPRPVPSTARIVMTRTALAHGKLDGLRLSGIQNPANPRGRPVAGAVALIKLIGDQPDPLRITLDLDAAGTQPRDPQAPGALVRAAGPLSSGMSLVVAELGPGDVLQRWDSLRTRFGSGNFYAAVSIPGSGIKAGMELVTNEQLLVYRANSIFFEAPDFGNQVIQHDLEGGTTNVQARVTNAGKERILTGKAAWANPLDLVLVEEGQKRGDGELQLHVQARLPMGFETALTIRWAAETSKMTRIGDVAVVATRSDTQVLAHTARFVIRLPGDTEGAVRLSAVATPGPFVHPLPRPPQSVQLNTFHSAGPTLEDTLSVQVKKSDIEDTIAKELDKVKAKSGDVQISLYWPSKDDLDLHVTTPSGETLYYGHRKSKDGGELDVDMNVNYGKAVAGAVENIYWPKGKAPAGKYKVYVHHYSNHGGRPGCSDPTPFHVRVVIQGSPQIFAGSVSSRDASKRKVLVHEFEVK